MPQAYTPPTSAPMLVPAMRSGARPCFSSACSTPMCARPRKAPPPRATPRRRGCSCIMSPPLFIDCTGCTRKGGLRMRQWLRKLVQGLVLGALLALLFLYPQAAMQGVREGLSLWANAVLPALLPFFVLTSLLLEGGMLCLLAPLAAPLCRLFRIPREAGWRAAFRVALRRAQRRAAGRLACKARGADRAGGFAPAVRRNGDEPALPRGDGGAGAGQSGAGRADLWYPSGSPRYATASFGGGTARTAARAAHAAPAARLRGAAARPAGGPAHELPVRALHRRGDRRSSPRSRACLRRWARVEALQRTLLFLLPPEAVPPLLAGALEVSNGCQLAASCALSLPVRASMLCALCAFGGLSGVLPGAGLSGRPGACADLSPRPADARGPLLCALPRGLPVLRGIPAHVRRAGGGRLPRARKSPCGAGAAPVPGLFPAALEAAPAPASEGECKKEGAFLPFPDRCCASIFRRGPRCCRPRRL